MLVTLVSGLFVGAIYGVFAVGLVLVYQVSRTVNFASANIGMLGAFVFTELVVSHGWPTWPAVALAGLVSAGLSGIGYLAIARPLGNKHPVPATLATFGLGTLLYSYAARRWGTRPIESAQVLKGKGWSVLGYDFTPDELLIVVLGLMAVVGVTLVLRRTTGGLRVRATAIDAEAASQSGIRTDLVALAVWAMAGLTTGIGAILVSSQVSLTVDFTASLMLRALVAALIGGLTNVAWAFVGGLVLGVTEAAVNFQVTTAGAAELVLGCLVVALLLVRPTGLKTAEY